MCTKRCFTLVEEVIHHAEHITVNLLLMVLLYVLILIQYGATDSGFIVSGEMTQQGIS